MYPDREPSYILNNKSPWLSDTRSLQIPHRLSNRRKINVQFNVKVLPRPFFMYPTEARNSFLLLITIFFPKTYLEVDQPAV
jgi:hypothetical protein